MNIELGDVGQLIHLAIAPAFLLAGIGTNLMVLTNRLSRIIDRARVLEDHLRTDDHPPYRQELSTLYARSHLISRAITLSTSCGLLICVVIAALFLGDAMNLALGKLIAACFVLAMVALICSFVYLLREIFVATASLSRRREKMLK